MNSKTETSHCSLIKQLEQVECIPLVTMDHQLLELPELIHTAEVSLVKVSLVKVKPIPDLLSNLKL